MNFVYLLAIIIIIVIILICINFVKIDHFSTLSAIPNVIDNNADRLILYYTDWCGISRQFKPIWDKFSQENKTKVITIAINCEIDKDACNLQLKGYPTVILYKANGQKIEFTEQRTLQNLHNFINKNKSY